MGVLQVAFHLLAFLAAGVTAVPVVSGSVQPRWGLIKPKVFLIDMVRLVFSRFCPRLSFLLLYGQNAHDHRSVSSLLPKATYGMGSKTSTCLHIISPCLDSLPSSLTRTARPTGRSAK